MSQDTFHAVANFFTGLGESAATQTELVLARYDQIILFHIGNEQPFDIRIAGGKVSPEIGGATDKIASVDDFMRLTPKVRDGRAAIAKGKAGDVPLEQNLLIRTDAATLSSMLERKLSLGDAIYERKLWIYGNVLKGEAMAWFSQLLRLNV